MAELEVDLGVMCVHVQRTDGSVLWSERWLDFGMHPSGTLSVGVPLETEDGMRVDVNMLFAPNRWVAVWKAWSAGDHQPEANVVGMWKE